MTTCGEREISIPRRRIEGDNVSEYVIIRNRDVIPIVEIAIGKFMSGVFELAKESNCTGEELEIIRIDIPSSGIGDTNKTKYVVTLNEDVSVIVEIALTEFMSNVFKLFTESKCSSNELEIIRIK